MNIAFLCRFYGQVERGAEVFVHELSSRLVALDHQVRIFPDSSGLSAFGPQVVISTNGRLDAVAARLWCIAHGAKLIIPGQSGPGIDDRWNLFTFPHIFVALTHHQQHWARQANPLVRTAVIPNGVDLNKFHPRVAPYKTKLPPPVVLYVAALTVSKRQDLLLAAAARLGVSVLLVGRGPRESALRLLGEHLLKDRFQLLSLSHARIPSVYTAAHVFTYPTVPWESFGISMLEAMACNRPVVATDDPIRREIVGTAGLFADPADTEKYAAALWQGIKRDWKFAPRARAEEFSWDKIAESYEKLFLSLAST